MAKKKKEIEDILIRQKEDRRLLSHVPDTSGLRTNQDRRSQNGHGGNHDFSDIIASDAAGRRYAVEYDVTMLSSMTSPSIVRERSPTPGGLTFRRQGCSFALIHLRNSTTQAKASQ